MGDFEAVLADKRQKFRLIEHELVGMIQKSPKNEPQNRHGEGFEAVFPQAKLSPLFKHPVNLPDPPFPVHQMMQNIQHNHGIEAIVVKREIAEIGHLKNSRLIFQVADLCNLPFDNNCFDAVIVLDVLHHLVDWKRGVREVNRVLKKGGKLCLREYSLETFSMPVLGLILRALLDHPYEFMFDQPELLSFIRKHGFEITHQNDMSWLLMLVAVKK